MRALVLWADGRSTNLGVRALAEGSEALVRRVWPDAEVVHQDFGSRIPQLPVGTIRSQARELVLGSRGAAAWLGEFDLVVDTRSGDSFADIYGLRRLALMSGVAEMVRRSGTPLVLGPQTIGPFRGRRARALARRSLRSASVVMARDSRSADHAAELGRPVDVLTTDVVFALDVPDVERSRDVVLNVSGLLWRDNPHVDRDRYRQIVSAVHARLVAEGREVSLLAHVLDSPSPDNDVPAVSEMAAASSGSTEVLMPSDLADVRRIVASANLVIGSRMHACLNALSCGTPAVALAYSRKFAPLLGDLGWDGVVDLSSDDDPVARVMDLALDPDLPARVQPVLTRAHESFARAESVLRGLA